MFFFRVVNFTQLHEKTMIENVYYLNTIMGTNSASRNNIWYNKKTFVTSLLHEP